MNAENITREHGKTEGQTGRAAMASLPLVQGEAKEEEVEAAQMTCFVGGMCSEPWQRQG